MPLIGLGLVDTVQEVQNLIDRVDEDGSGEIEFDEFLHIIYNLSGSPGKAESPGINTTSKFFKDLTSGKFVTGGQPFLNWVLQK